MMVSKLLQSITLLYAMMLACGTQASATSCIESTTPISAVMADTALVFKGRPIYYSQRTKPGSTYRRSTVFKVEKIYRGAIGDYGQYSKIFHDSPYQNNKSYLIVAKRQQNGDLIEKGGYCGLGFSDDDIIAFIKTGKSAIPQGCIKHFRRAYKAKYLDGWPVSQDQICQQYMPAFNRKYPNLVKKNAAEK